MPSDLSMSENKTLTFFSFFLFWVQPVNAPPAAAVRGSVHGAELRVNKDPKTFRVNVRVKIIQRIYLIRSAVELTFCLFRFFRLRGNSAARGFYSRKNSEEQNSDPNLQSQLPHVFPPLCGRNIHGLWGGTKMNPLSEANKGSPSLRCGFFTFIIRGTRTPRGDAS